ncbi:copper resistance B precursor [Novosphingobium sp. Rr 2-17]|uniref:copper resistance protein B n=1 Tax=Novosphingobium sp. Rr 2-17 TaxID=555793 RepID=UPI0002698162|nr:copper resistance protein B [Novosphingobium sp. Rr 2-17]EIZ81226.1 copper resistance B precursor [Novosphingobium sp. Rr 2-17]
MIRTLTALLSLSVAATSASAQTMDHSTMDHGHPDQRGQQATDAPKADQPAADPHAGHDNPATAEGIPKGKAPPPPTDHAADAVYDRTVMARARDQMIRESGGMVYSKFMLDRLEYQAQKGADGYHWEGEGWIGGDINRLAIKSEGEGTFGGPLEQAELQLLYSRAIDPWWNVVGGVRQDFRPSPQRTYATVGIEGLAPYLFEMEAQAFVSDKGDAHLRIEGSYDQRITQRLILQPAAEVNFAAQDVPEIRTGSGLSNIELGLRLRYEIAREFAPYVGINWERKLGDTARYARQDGDRASATSLVTGIRFWF